MDIDKGHNVPPHTPDYRGTTAEPNPFQQSEAGPDHPERIELTETKTIINAWGNGVFSVESAKQGKGPMGVGEITEKLSAHQIGAAISTIIARGYTFEGGVAPNFLVTEEGWSSVIVAKPTPSITT